MNAELNDFPGSVMNEYQVEQSQPAYENAISDKYVESQSPASALGIKTASD